MTLLSVVFTDLPSKWIQSSGAGLFETRTETADGPDREDLGIPGLPTGPEADWLPAGGEWGVCGATVRYA